MDEVGDVRGVVQNDEETMVSGTGVSRSDRHCKVYKLLVSFCGTSSRASEGRHCPTCEITDLIPLLPTPFVSPLPPRSGRPCKVI